MFSLCAVKTYVENIPWKPGFNKTDKQKGNLDVPFLTESLDKKQNKKKKKKKNVYRCFICIPQMQMILFVTFSF